MTRERVIHKVSVTAPPVSVRVGYHAISVCVIRRVAVTAATAAARAGYHSCNYRAWSIYGQE